jgi:hypothetical protein
LVHVRVRVLVHVRVRVLVHVFVGSVYLSQYSRRQIKNDRLTSKRTCRLTTELIVSKGRFQVLFLKSQVTVLIALQDKQA